MFDLGEAPDPVSSDFFPVTKLQLVNPGEYVRSTLLATTSPQFRGEFSDVTLVLEDGQVQSYRGLLSPWLGQLLLASGGDCNMVILPGTDSRLFIQQLGGAREEVVIEDVKEKMDESATGVEEDVTDMTEAKGLVKENTIGMEIGNETPAEAIAYCEALVKKEEHEEETSNRSMFSILKDSFPNLPESAAFSIEEPQVASSSFHSCLPLLSFLHPTPFIPASFYIPSCSFTLTSFTPGSFPLTPFSCSEFPLPNIFSSPFPCSPYFELLTYRLLSSPSQTVFSASCLLQTAFCSPVLLTTICSLSCSHSILI